MTARVLRLVLPALGLAAGAAWFPGAAAAEPAASTPAAASRPVALFAERVLEFVAREGAVTAHLLLDPPGRPTARGRTEVRLRLAVEDPDGALEAVEVQIDGAPAVLLDQQGEVRDRAPVGFLDRGETGYVAVPVAPRGGPHRLRLRPRARQGMRDDRWSGRVRLLGARLVDPVRLFEGMRDLADLLARRYHLLRDLDLRVRQRDPRLPPLDPGFRGVWHSRDTFEAHLERPVRLHFDAIAQLTFRSHLRKADPVRYLWEALAYFQEIYLHWHEAPAGARESFLYAAGPALYEYLDEASLAFARVRESYFPLVGAAEGAAADPVGPSARALRDLRGALENLLVLSRQVLVELEARAEQVAGPRELTPADYPRAEAICRASRTLQTPPPFERRGYGTSFASHGPGAASLGEVRGVGRAEGPTCTPCRPRAWQERDVRKDRYRPERRHLAVYLDLVRGLVQHDLALVRMWQALLEGRSLGLSRVRAPDLQPQPLAWLSREAAP